MIDIIAEGMELHILERWTTVHNYIDTESRILRKGAVSAQKGEKLLIPINMRDGSLICVGKGNEDWNCSAPHGAGRLMSRKKAREQLSLDEFWRSMEGVYTTSANLDTLDESPFAYRPIGEILPHIGDTAAVVETIKPVYNFKAGG
jgi:RNA-splicing ligase RtcB